MNTKLEFGLSRIRERYQVSSGGFSNILAFLRWEKLKFQAGDGSDVYHKIEKKCYIVS